MAKAKKAKKKVAKKKAKAPAREECPGAAATEAEVPVDAAPVDKESLDAGSTGADRVSLDPALIERALSYGFTERQINGFKDNGTLDAALCRCKPPVAVTERAPKTKPKERIRQTNQIPKNAKVHRITAKAVTPRDRIGSRNRLAYDGGVAQSTVFQFVKEHRQEGQVFCKNINYHQSNEPDKMGSLVTDIEITMAVQLK